MPYHLAMAPYKIGAVDETRTRDLHLGKVALYQLSYYRAASIKRVIYYHKSFQKSSEIRIFYVLFNFSVLSVNTP